METLACQLTQYHLQYKQLKISPLNAHEKRKIYREIVDSYSRECVRNLDLRVQKVMGLKISGCT